MKTIDKVRVKESQLSFDICNEIINKNFRGLDTAVKTKKQKQKPLGVVSPN